MGYIDLLAKGAETLLKNRKVQSTAGSTIAERTGIIIGDLFRIKPEITMPVRINTLKANSPLGIIDKATVQTLEGQGELGNLSLRFADSLKSKEANAKTLAQKMFGGIDSVEEISVRAKDANSLYSKLERLVKKGNTIGKDADAHALIGDAMGIRVRAKHLTLTDALNAIKTTKVEGKNLSIEDQKLVERLFRNDSTLSTQEIKLAEQIARPVKIALAEKQSQPLFERMMLSNLKDALNRKKVTMEQLRKAEFDERLLKELETNSNITPIRMVEVNNYKGLDGIPNYSDNQIMQIKRMALATGEDIKIINCPEKYDLTKYNIKNLTADEQDAIKSSGYITTQLNVVLPDGTLAEVQFRGSSLFAEYEHIAYDSRMGKNTLGKTFDEYKKAILSLKDNEFDEYNAYLRQCYNYYRNQELGLVVGEKPVLPAKFDQILSQENMEKLHALNKANNEILMKDFVPHVEPLFAAVA